MAKTIRRNFPVVGLGCAACVNRVEGAIKAQKGVEACSVSLAANNARVDYDPQTVKAAELKKAVQDAGYDLLVEEDSDETSDAELLEEEAEKIRRKAYDGLKTDMVVAIILGLAIMVIQMGFKAFEGRGIVLLALAAVSVFWCGRRFHKAALSQVKHLKANMDTLVSLSTLISFLFSCFNLAFPKVTGTDGSPAPLYFDSAAMITAFILIGRVLEERARYGTTASIRKLMDLRPRKEKARVGEIIKVKPGSRIPADGTVSEGSSFVDESLLTGEPVPVEKLPGSPVYTGTMNGNGLLRVKVEKTGEDTLLAGIIRMVRDAQGSKPKIQETVDKVAAVFVPVIIIIALVTFFYWCFFAPGGGFANALLYMVSVLVIACPCSLGLATPTAIVAGIGNGADNGILIKDADALQLARKTDAVVLDKTGTLTVGKPEVLQSKWYAEKAKGILLAIEQSSGHPLAEALTKSLGEEIVPVEVSDFLTLPGSGVEAWYMSERYFVGNTAPEPCPLGEAWREEGYTVVYFSDDAHVLAVFAIADKLKDTSADAVAELGAMNIRTAMLTGDTAASAARISAGTGISEVRAGVLPADKVAYIKALQAQKKVVAMAGDGINDSAALATADVGIAMGRGSDIAMDSAMVTIVSSDLRKIPQLIRLSKKTSRIISENLFWAFIYNVIAVPMAAGLFGFRLNPMTAAACMALSSVCVVCNSLRLRHSKQAAGVNCSPVQGSSPKG